MSKIVNDQVRAVEMGMLYVTPGVILKIKSVEVFAALDRHASCDWGLICDQDREANEEALIHGFRIMSVYKDSKNTNFWIITEADRSVTTVLLPEEY